MTRFLILAMVWIAIAMGLQVWVQYGVARYEGSVQRAVKEIEKIQSGAFRPITDPEQEDKNKTSGEGSSDDKTGAVDAKPTVDLSLFKALNETTQRQMQMNAKDIENARSAMKDRIRTMWIILTFLPLFAGGWLAVRGMSTVEDVAEADENQV